MCIDCLLIVELKEFFKNTVQIQVPCQLCDLLCLSSTDAGKPPSSLTVLRRTNEDAVNENPTLMSRTWQVLSYLVSQIWRLSKLIGR